MQLGRLRSWGAKNASALSVVGALVIFFSWTVTTTLSSRYASLKSSVEAAQANFRLYTTLDELRGSLHSVAMEVIQRDARPAPPIDDPASARSRAQRASLAFDSARLSAYQVKALSAFALETKYLSQTLRRETTSASQVDEALGPILQLSAALAKLEATVEKVDRSNAQSVAEFEVAVDAYVRGFREEILPQVAALYQKIVRAANLVTKEADAALTLAKAKADWAQLVALVLYVLGSILAIGGQYFDKIEKARLRNWRDAA